MEYFILFSGHMIDKEDRCAARFPASKVVPAGVAIRDAVREVIRNMHGREVRGIAAAACGGDILFHEVCMGLGVRSEVFLGTPIAEFEKTSVSFAGSDWVQRYRKLVRELPVHVLFPEAKADTSGSVWEKANEWMLKAALQEGVKSMALIALWDGQEGDVCGGTRHMVNVARAAGAMIEIIDVLLL